MWGEPFLDGLRKLTVQRIKNDLDNPFLLLILAPFQVQTLNYFTKWKFFGVTNALDTTVDLFDKSETLDLPERVKIYPRTPTSDGIDQRTVGRIRQTPLKPSTGNIDDAFNRCIGCAVVGFLDNRFPDRRHFHQITNRRRIRRSQVDIPSAGEIART